MSRRPTSGTASTTPACTGSPGTTARRSAPRGCARSAGGWKAERVAVLAEFRKHGVGAALMRALEAEAWRRGAARVLLARADGRHPVLRATRLHRRGARLRRGWHPAPQDEQGASAVLIRDQLASRANSCSGGAISCPRCCFPLRCWRSGTARWLDGRLGPTLDDTFEWLCLCVSAGGVALRFAVAGCVPRAPRVAARSGLVADELNTTGIYSLLRHPLYLANFLIFAGFLLAIGSLWFAAVREPAPSGCTTSASPSPRRSSCSVASASTTSPGRRRRRRCSRACACGAGRALPFCWRSAAEARVPDPLRDPARLRPARPGRGLRRARPLRARAGSSRCCSRARCSLFPVIRFLHKRTRWLHVPGR